MYFIMQNKNQTTTTKIEGQAALRVHFYSKDCLVSMTSYPKVSLSADTANGFFFTHNSRTVHLMAIAMGIKLFVSTKYTTLPKKNESLSTSSPKLFTKKKIQNTKSFQQNFFLCQLPIIEGAAACPHRQSIEHPKTPPYQFP